uniref:Selenoprotein P2 n=1 Tax=Cyprinodon variegatus TaxID=28743 RepID=A0A3Q2CJ26_CYPVA
MRSLLVLWLSAAVPALLWVSQTTPLVGADKNSSRICQPAPDWAINGRSPLKELQGHVVVVALIGRLRTKLARRNITEVSFMIINEQENSSRANYWALKNRAPAKVPVYQQDANGTDVWEILDGDKDDFLIYDRCGHLTFHIVLPYSSLNHPYVETAIRATYLTNICSCSVSDQMREQVAVNKNHSDFLRSSLIVTSAQSTARPPDEGNTPPTKSPNKSTHHHSSVNFYHHNVKT